MKWQLINTYKNWDSIVSIYSDWTKVRDAELWCYIEYPESMDLKITNYCWAWCVRCHEQSTIEWKHWDLKKCLTYLNLPEWVEIAIWWWNPLDHPDYIWFIKELRKKWLIPNTTINAFHIVKPEYKELVMEAQKYCYAIWISYNKGLNISNTQYINKDNVVIHLIAWVDELSDIDRCIEMWFTKFLILWFKVYWRWKWYYSERVEKWIMKWYTSLHKYIWKVTISFDNLAIRQLNARRWFDKESRDKFYMWDDWNFTMYIDAVEDKFAVCSFSDRRYDTLKDIKDMFYIIKNNNV